MQVPQAVIDNHEAVFRNMLGLVRGRIFYNLANWYHLLYLFPGTAQSKSFMETMMGVKQGLKPEIAALFDFAGSPLRYSVFARLRLLLSVLLRLLFVRGLIERFEKRVDAIVAEGRHKNFSRMSLQEQAQYYHYLTDRVLKHWQAPIVNDTRCMVFFGLLKSLTARWFSPSDDSSTLQNDLLCGQGELESTEPTRMLMRIASEIDNGPENRRSWFLSQRSTTTWNQLLEGGVFPELYLRFKEFLDLYGFRCVNELKLEEPDLHDDPSFAIEAVASYVRMKSYSIEAMEAREAEIRTTAENFVANRLGGPFGAIRRSVFNFVLKNARQAVRDRENLRFDRTKTFGIVRHLFRGFGKNLADLGALEHAADVFYLTIDEIIGYIEGRGVSLNLKGIAALRRAEFDDYRRLPDPPDRFTTRGAAGASFFWPQILSAHDLLVNDEPVSTDPNVLLGTACCPGVVEGVVRVVHSMSDALGLAGEILVTERTDPGWVPLYPACSGLLIERGSLLSHSAVVARELGLPTIVGVRGGLVKRLRTGMRVRMDAARGEVRILKDHCDE
jgi:pyruvate,water dikinase